MRKDPWKRQKSLYSSLVPKATEKKKVKWKILPILWLALKRTCMTIGAVTLFFSLLTILALPSAIEGTHKPLPKEMVLYLPLDGELSETIASADFDPFAKEVKTLKQFLQAIENAKNDPRVKGIYSRIGGKGYNLTHIQEIRDAIIDFRKSGKFAYLYASSMGGGLGNYYLASAFDEIWMQPMGVVAIAGLNAEMPFARDLLDKVGVTPNFYQRKEYKTAYENLTNSQMSDANRQAMGALIKDFSEIIVSDVAAARGLKTERFEKLIDQGIFLDQDAKDAGLIDHVAYVDQLAEKMNKIVTGDPKDKDLEYIPFNRYLKESVASADAQILNKTSEKPRIALIYVVGAIIDSNNGQAASGYATADTISAALFEAAEDDTVDAVVLRVDSPGGSPVASETILRAVEKVKEKKKPVIVSMGSMAASGGYWVSAYADYIFVRPTTITGSIGVLGGKFSAEGLWDKLGVNWDRIQYGENAAIWSMSRPFTSGEEERVNAMLDNIYDGFLERVSKGRNMSVEQVEQIARGRVWSGISAVDVGIADEIGGFNDALEYAADKIGAPNRHGADIYILPKPLTKMEQLLQLLEMQVFAGYKLGAYGQYLERFEPVLSDLMQIVDNQGRVRVYQDPIHVE